MKNCPYCGRQINHEALLCPFCQKELSQQAPAPAAPREAPAVDVRPLQIPRETAVSEEFVKKPRPSRRKIWIFVGLVILGLLILGALRLVKSVGLGSGAEENSREARFKAEVSAIHPKMVSACASRKLISESDLGSPKTFDSGAAFQTLTQNCQEKNTMNFSITIQGSGGASRLKAVCTEKSCRFDQLQ